MVITGHTLSMHLQTFGNDFKITESDLTLGIEETDEFIPEAEILQDDSVLDDLFDIMSRHIREISKGLSFLHEFRYLRQSDEISSRRDEYRSPIIENILSY